MLLRCESLEPPMSQLGSDCAAPAGPNTRQLDPRKLPLTLRNAPGEPLNIVAVLLTLLLKKYFAGFRYSITSNGRVLHVLESLP